MKRSLLAISLVLLTAALIALKPRTGAAPGALQDGRGGNSHFSIEQQPPAGSTDTRGKKKCSLRRKKKARAVIHAAPEQASIDSLKEAKTREKNK